MGYKASDLIGRLPDAFPATADTAGPSIGPAERESIQVETDDFSTQTYAEYSFGRH